MFTRDFVQAVNDWQRGGDHKQKIRRGGQLKSLASNLPIEFRTCDTECFRQEAHEKDRIWQLLANNCLPETIAAWTIDLGVAKTFKGGVPPAGLQGVIFSVRPAQDSVILNLDTLYSNKDFQSAVKASESSISAFGNGIGRWRNSQREVILEIPHLNLATVHCYGGFSISREELAEMYFGRSASAHELDEFDKLCDRAGEAPGAGRWLSPDGTKAVLDRMEPHIARLKIRKTQENNIK
jgi:hypothetical protein